MKMILFFDFDGTLRTKEKVEEEVLRKLFLLQEKGYELVLNTGRSRAFYLKDNADGFPFDGFLFAAEQIIWKGKEIYCRVASKEEMEQVVSYFDQKGKILVFEGIHRVKGYSREEYEMMKKEDKLSSFIEDWTNEVSKFTIIGNDFQEEDASHFPTMSFLVCHGNFFHVEICPDGSNKGKLMRKFLDFLPLEERKTYAFGDSENDFEMLQEADVSVCMEHAPEQVKKKADKVYPDILTALNDSF